MAKATKRCLKDLSFKLILLRENKRAEYLGALVMILFRMGAAYSAALCQVASLRYAEKA